MDRRKISGASEALMKRRALDKRLCSLELHAPSQMRWNNAFSLFASLSFDIKDTKNIVDGDKYYLRFGFHAAELGLSFRHCTMAATDRYLRVLQPITIKMETTRDATKVGGAEGRASLGFPAVFGFFTAAGKFSSSRHSAVKVTRTETNEIQIQCAVVQRHGEYWRVYGIDNPDGVLCGQILGDEKLCVVLHQDRKCEIAAEVSGDLGDLWIKLDRTDQPDVIQDANRQAICLALLAKSFRPPDSDFDMEDNRGSILLASDRLTFDPTEAGAENRPTYGMGAT